MPGPATALLRQTAQRVKGSPNPIAAAAGKCVADEVKAQLKIDGSRLAGRRLGVSVKVFGSVVEVSASPRKAIGAWTILERGTSAHTVRAKRARDSEAMRIGGAWRTGPWRVSGVRGKGTWSTGVANARPKIPDVGAKVLKEVIRGG